MPGPVIVPILGDQLSRQIASIRGCAKDDTVILIRPGFTPVEARPGTQGLERGLGWCAAETASQL